MIPVSGGDSFVGLDGFTYTAATGVTIEVGQGAIRQAFLRNWTEAPLLSNIGATIVTPLTGFAYTVPNGTQALVLTPAGTIATGTITTPPNPQDNQPLRLSSSQTVTALTVSANTGQTVVGAPTTITSTAPVEFFWNAQNATWYRR
jgi:hypothetical protein